MSINGRSNRPEERVTEMIDICLFGAGLIGSVHAGNLARHPKARLRYIVDPRPEAAQRIAAQTGAKIVDTETALSDPTIKAVMIASATKTHAELAMVAAAKGKAIFCEKPIDLDIGRTDECLAAIEKAGALFQIGFNRRFDPSFRALKERLDAGEIGSVEQVIITSRDPEAETEEALAGGGGVFREMTIHDFDMARNLLGEEPVELFATGSCLVLPYYAKHGDYDTAMFVLRTASGRQCHINNSVRAVYGYDQRIEVHGSNGMLRAGNRMPTSVEAFGSEAVSRDKPLYFFVERYMDSYYAELDHFIECVLANKKPDVGASDGRKAMILCEAALASAKSGRFEPIKF
ncbi:myo-inositol 2-dehydrogenase/D-chiro-inositol 1-dehydrogenase [Rhizobium sp. 57MFTsu3.2]|nr:myo-inositol 2-dehydrogenase/D-chiro-inositol 1-dehydrogenase [Rhizobium sp. 57MFTsu3.2]